MERAVVAGVAVAVVLPVGYRRTHHRFPLVVLLHGAQGDEDSWIEYGSLMSSTARQPERGQAIVVMPKMGVVTGFAADWVDGFRKDATFVGSTLVRWADSHYRTLPRRSARAIAGYSGGGLSAIHVAERFPAVFGTVGVLSGASVAGDPASQSAAYAAFFAEQLCAGDDPAAAGVLGDPVTHAASWQAADPVRHADRLRGSTVFVSSGNGVPCDAADGANLAYPTAATEPQIRRAATALVEALSAAGIQHTVRKSACGLHWWTNWTPALAQFWSVAAKRWNASA
ncbi:MAG TPA: alpha/beta hydrolase-fold protein [Mycobacteriales bacterium]|nr:alpha/beta hydrolase-fold protein [Mycobacteriales bacterium]